MLSRFSPTLMTNGVRGVLVGVEPPQHEQVDGEADQAEGEAGQRPRRVDGGLPR